MFFVSISIFRVIGHVVVEISPVHFSYAKADYVSEILSGPTSLSRTLSPFLYSIGNLLCSTGLHMSCFGPPTGSPREGAPTATVLARLGLPAQPNACFT